MLSIQFNARLEIPPSVPVLDTVEPKDAEERSRALSEQLGISARARDLGLWHVTRDERAVLEVYQASSSFRYELLGLDGEARDGGDGIPEGDAVGIAKEWMSAFWPSDAEPEIGEVTEREVMIAERDSQPRQLVAGVDVNIRFSHSGLRLLGPGSKAQVCVNREGQVVAAYQFWRDVSATSKVRTRPLDEIFERFAASSLFADLSDDTARAEVSDAQFGYLCLPPTEPMQTLVPVVRLRGIIATEYQERYEFIRYMYAVEPKRQSRGRKGVNTAPSLVLG
jgi:hypothetical protein